MGCKEKWTAACCGGVVLRASSAHLKHHGVGSFASLPGGSLKHTEGLCGQTFLSGFRINSESRSHPGLGMMSANLEWSGRVGRGFLPPGECEFAGIWSIMRTWAASRAERKGEEHRSGGQSEPGASTDRLAGKPAPSFPADPTRVSRFMGTSSMWDSVVSFATSTKPEA